jgi:arylsulfatase
MVATLLATTAMAGLPARGAPAAGRPNIITIVLDDVGYSDLGCFGGEIHTPNIDRLAARGLRYTRFDTKAVCSATRASLLTGRNCHTVNMPDVPDVASVPGAVVGPPSIFHLPGNARTSAQVLRDAGYATWLVGKWHLIPMDQLKGQTGRDTWPLQRGFDYFYGFARGWTDQFHPDLVEGNDYIHPDLPAGYHLSQDLVDKALSRIEGHQAEKPGQPFFLHLAFGAAHAPIQAPRDYIERYAHRYDVGWDEIRSRRFERMKQMHVIPPETRLPPRNPNDRAWADLSEDERVVFARFMEVYAGFLEHADAQIGRLLDVLDQRGLARDTLIVLLSDNGAASEAGQAGEFDGLYRPNKLTPAEERVRLAELGTGATQALYPRPWAMAGVAPFRRYKLWPYLGGVRTPMVVAWPGHIDDAGAFRRQQVDVVDVAPTLVAAAGTAFPPSVGGRPEIPLAGRSFIPTFSDPGAPAPRSVQYFELRGNRAITAGRWRAVALHDCGMPYAADRWELFDTDADPSESIDLAAARPAVLARLKSLWDGEWRRYAPGPLLEPSKLICAIDKAYDAPANSLGQGD